MLYDKSERKSEVGSEKKRRKMKKTIEASD